MAEYYFRTQQLTVGYDGRPLIRDISVDIARGEIVTLIGPNGSGKSTILKSITRQLRTLGGAVFVAGEELALLSQRALATKMAVVLTERMKPELMTCRDIVATGRYPYPGRLGVLSEADERQVEAAMRAVQVLELRNRDFNAISDGQRQRVLLARAICQQPEIIVLDEPTSFLDIRHKLQLLELLREMAKQKGITVILSLHEIDLAQKVSDRIVCVKGDHIARFGAPEEVFDEAVIRELYGIDRGSYDPMFGSVELPRPEGTPATFVICGGGTGIPVFRALQKAGIPFAAGILHENDVDAALARRLASAVVTERAFEPVSEAALAEALSWLGRCGTVINAGPPLGSMNARVAELIERARAMKGYEEVPR